MSGGRWLALVLVASGLLACSKQGQVAGATASPDRPHPPAPPPGAPHQESPATTASPFAPPSPEAAPGTFPQNLPREVQIMGAVILLESEFQQLQGSLSACDVACRSLASMERSVRVICSLTQGDERVRCDDARRRLREARTRVREACKACSDGTRTDPEDPEP